MKNIENVSFKFLWSCEKILKKSGEYLVQIFQQPDGNFVTVLCQFLEKLAKNYGKNMKLFWKNFRKIGENYKEIILGTF